MSMERKVKQPTISESITAMLAVLSLVSWLAFVIYLAWGLK